MDDQEQLSIVDSALTELIEPKWEEDPDGESEEVTQRRAQFNRGRGRWIWRIDRMDEKYGPNVSESLPDSKTYNLAPTQTVQLTFLLAFSQPPLIERRCRSTPIFDKLGPIGRTGLNEGLHRGKVEVHVPNNRLLSLDNAATGNQYDYLQEYMELQRT